ncbi:hypothetical protein BB558_006350 [Smittium angustum]|uniref:Ubiquitin-like domain-containing protein n=1 Tax=Smittium angustum TaxID=133377 RepID=A0A2U1IXZ4_SMIAN|nr:hypothetical protein BB558_006350 [Smittium angustum]
MEPETKFEDVQVLNNNEDIEIPKNNSKMRALSFIICSPTVDTPDNFSVDTPINSKVLDLKREIEIHHPLHPKASTLRLIYKGKLLVDKDDISPVAESSLSGDTPVIHMVVNLLKNPHIITSKPTKTESSSKNEPAAVSIDSPTKKNTQDDSSIENPGEPNTKENNIYDTSQNTSGGIQALSSKFQYLFIDGQVYLAVWPNTPPTIEDRYSHVFNSQSSRIGYSSLASSYPPNHYPVLGTNMLPYVSSYGSIHNNNINGNILANNTFVGRDPIYNQLGELELNELQVLLNGEIPIDRLAQVIPQNNDPNIFSAVMSTLSTIYQNLSTIFSYITLASVTRAFWMFFKVGIFFLLFLRDGSMSKLFTFACIAISIFVLQSEFLRTFINRFYERNNGNVITNQPQQNENINANPEIDPNQVNLEDDNTVEQNTGLVDDGAVQENILDQISVFGRMRALLFALLFSVLPSTPIVLPQEANQEI